jgi:hypothetical protein
MGHYWGQLLTLDTTSPANPATERCGETKLGAKRKHGGPPDVRPDPAKPQCTAAPARGEQKHEKRCRAIGPRFASATAPTLHPDGRLEPRRFDGRERTCQVSRVDPFSPRMKS